MHSYNGKVCTRAVTVTQIKMSQSIVNCDCNSGVVTVELYECFR